MILVVGQNSSWQNTYRMSRLIAGGVNRVEAVYRSAAGKGANITRCLSIFGLAGHLLGYAGGPSGEKFVQACRQEDIQATFVKTERETRTCTTLVLPGGESTEIIEPAPAVTVSERVEFRARFDDLLPSAKILAIGGTALAGEPVECYRELADRARRGGIAIFLDSYRAHGRKALEASPNVLKINADELADLSGRASGTALERESACAEIRERFGIELIIITLGREGAEAYTAKANLSARAPRIGVVNPIGSGDAFAAGAIAALHEFGTTPEGAVRALLYGVAMGSANCLNIQTGLVAKADFESLSREVKIG